MNNFNRNKPMPISMSLVEIGTNTSLPIFSRLYVYEVLILLTVKEDKFIDVENPGDYADEVYCYGKINYEYKQFTSKQQHFCVQINSNNEENLPVQYDSEKLIEQYPFFYEMIRDATFKIIRDTVINKFDNAVDYQWKRERLWSYTNVNKKYA